MCIQISSLRRGCVGSRFSLRFRLELFFKLLEPFVNLVPLRPLMFTIFKASSKRQPASFLVSHTPYSSDGFLHANNPPSSYKLLTLADAELEKAHFVQAFLRHSLCQAVVKQVEELNDDSGEAAGQAIDRGNATDGEDWQKVLAKTGENIEVVVVDSRTGCNKGLIVNDPMRELRADDVRVGGELFERSGSNVEVVRDA